MIPITVPLGTHTCHSQPSKWIKMYTGLNFSATSPSFPLSFSCLVSFKRVAWLIWYSFYASVACVWLNLINYPTCCHTVVVTADAAGGPQKNKSCLVPLTQWQSEYFVCFISRKNENELSSVLLWMVVVVLAWYSLFLSSSLCWLLIPSVCRSWAWSWSGKDALKSRRCSTVCEMNPRISPSFSLLRQKTACTNLLLSQSESHSYVRRVLYYILPHLIRNINSRFAKHRKRTT